MNKALLEHYYETHQDYCALVEKGGAIARQMVDHIENDIAHIESGEWDFFPLECLQRRLESLEDLYDKIKDFY